MIAACLSSCLSALGSGVEQTEERGRSPCCGLLQMGCRARLFATSKQEPKSSHVNFNTSGTHKTLWSGVSAATAPDCLDYLVQLHMLLPLSLIVSFDFKEEQEA